MKKTLKRMRAYILFGAFTLAGGICSLGGMDWPSQTGTMSSNFALNDGGRPLLGSSFEGEGPILAAEKGELIFSRDSSDTASRLPSPLGAWIALDHGDEIISIYGRFDDQNPYKPADIIEKQAPLASMGISGWTNKRGFYFSLFDRKERRWVNPSMIIAPFQDTRPPVIQTVRLRNREGGEIDPLQAKTLKQGRYTVLVGAGDTLGPSGAILAPYRIVCSLNGTEIGALTFETFSARDGSLMVYRNGLIPVKQIYSPSNIFDAGEVWFTRGQVTLEIIVQDITGNTRNAVYRLIVE
jgi:hypothetical protein